MRNSKWQVATVILNMVIRGSLIKMILEQTHKRDVDEPCGCLKYTPRTRDNSKCKGSGAETDNTSVW